MQRWWIEFKGYKKMRVWRRENKWVWWLGIEVVSNRAAGMDLNWLENFPRHLKSLNSGNLAANLNHGYIVCMWAYKGEILSYKEIYRDEAICHCHHNLHLLYTTMDRSQFRCFSQEAWHLNQLSNIYLKLNTARGSPRALKASKACWAGGT